MPTNVINAEQTEAAPKKISVRGKGQRAERAVIKLLQPVVTEAYEARGLEAPKLQRNQMQTDGGGFDIIGLEWMALEVKHQETLNVEAWWRQTIKQAKGNAEPILIYKQNNVKWRVRLLGKIYVYKWAEHQTHIVEMSEESFLEYFKARLIGELEG